MTMSPESGGFNPEEDFEKRKREFFSRLAVRVKDAMKLHKEAGLWDRKDGKRDWGNVSEHCLVEVARADVMANWLGLTSETKDNLMMAAALHDFYKSHEMKKVKDAMASGESNWDAFEESSKESQSLMRAAGFSESVIHLAQSVGHGSFLETEEILKKDALSEDDRAFLALHYIDEYTRGSDWASPAETLEGGKKINELDRRVDKNESNVNYRRLDEEGRVRFGGETTFQAQRRIGHDVEDRLAREVVSAGVSVEDSKDLPEMIDKEIHEKISGSI